VLLATETARMVRRGSERALWVHAAAANPGDRPTAPCRIPVSRRTRRPARSPAARPAAAAPQLRSLNTPSSLAAKAQNGPETITMILFTRGSRFQAEVQRGSGRFGQRDPSSCKQRAHSSGQGWAGGAPVARVAAPAQNQSMPTVQAVGRPRSSASPMTDTLGPGKWSPALCQAPQTGPAPHITASVRCFVSF